MLRQQVCGGLPALSAAIVSATASAAAVVQTRDPTVPQDYPPCAVSTLKFNDGQFNIKGDMLTQG